MNRILTGAAAFAVLAVVVYNDSPVGHSNLIAASDCGVGLVVHRGLQTNHDENTTGAIVDAGDIGTAEIDVRLTADDQPVLMHDPGIGRTTDGHGDVHEMTLAAIQAHRTEPRGERVPTFGQAVRAAKQSDTTLLVELKTRPNHDQWTLERVEALGQTARQHGWGSRIWVYPLSEADIPAWSEAAPNLHWVFKTDRGDPYDVATVQAMGDEVDAAMLFSGQTTRALVDDFHDAGYRVITRMTNRADLWERERRDNVDALLSRSPVKFTEWCEGES